MQLISQKETYKETSEFAVEWRKIEEKDKVMVNSYTMFQIIKKRLQHSFFPVKFAKFLSTPFSTEHLRWLPLKPKKHKHVALEIIQISFSKNED